MAEAPHSPWGHGLCRLHKPGGLSRRPGAPTDAICVLAGWCHGVLRAPTGPVHYWGLGTEAAVQGSAPQQLSTVWAGSPHAMHVPRRPACVLAGTGPGGQPPPTALGPGSASRQSSELHPQADSRNSIGYCDDKSSPTNSPLFLLERLTPSPSTSVPQAPPRRPQGQRDPCPGPWPPEASASTLWPGFSGATAQLSPRLLLTLPTCPRAPAPPPLGRASAACHTPHSLPLGLEAPAGPGPLAPAEHSGM